MAREDDDASVSNIEKAYWLTCALNHEFRRSYDAFDAYVAMAVRCYPRAAGASHLIATMIPEERSSELGDRYRPSKFSPAPEPKAIYKTLEDEEDHLPPVERVWLLLGDLRYEIHRQYETVEEYRDMIARCRPVVVTAVRLLRDLLPQGRKPDP
ncbi:MAG: hypothetical protein ROR55_01300 [Devosia sp.]